MKGNFLESSQPKDGFNSSFSFEIMPKSHIYYDKILLLVHFFSGHKLTLLSCGLSLVIWSTTESDGPLSNQHPQTEQNGQKQHGLFEPNQTGLVYYSCTSKGCATQKCTAQWDLIKSTKKQDLCAEISVFCGKTLINDYSTMTAQGLGSRTLSSCSWSGS